MWFVVEFDDLLFFRGFYVYGSGVKVIFEFVGRKYDFSY